MNEGARVTAPILVLVGPTAIGKTALSLEIATRFGCEIISMDSMQVYRYMDIGTAKASLEERVLVPHHLIDIVDPDDQYDAARFVANARRAIAEITGRGRVPLLTGGTGLYLMALTKGLFTEISVPTEIRDSLRRRLALEGREQLHRELCAVDPQSGAVCGMLGSDGSLRDGTQRIWAQAEYLRALTLREDGLVRVQRQLQALQQHFLHAGGWYECLDAQGQVSREDMPSTTPYHLATCYSGLAQYFNSGGSI